MYLKDIDFGTKVKCYCKECRGSGVEKTILELDDIASICRSCGGKGYHTLKSNNDLRLVLDEKRKIVYLLHNGIIFDSEILFNGIVKMEDVNYVMFPISAGMSHSNLKKLGATEENLISYDDLIKGNLPIPMVKSNCPHGFSAYYKINGFDNGCKEQREAVYEKYGFRECWDVYCEKYGSQECWDLFYRNAKTTEEKQRLLKRMVQ